MSCILGALVFSLSFSLTHTRGIIAFCPSFSLPLFIVILLLFWLCIFLYLRSLVCSYIHCASIIFFSPLSRPISTIDKQLRCVIVVFAFNTLVTNLLLNYCSCCGENERTNDRGSGRVGMEGNNGNERHIESMYDCNLPANVFRYCCYCIVLYSVYCVYELPRIECYSFHPLFFQFVSFFVSAVVAFSNIIIYYRQANQRMSVCMLSQRISAALYTF